MIQFSDKDRDDEPGLVIAKAVLVAAWIVLGLIGAGLAAWWAF